MAPSHYIFLTPDQTCQSAKSFMQLSLHTFKGLLDVWKLQDFINCFKTKENGSTKLLHF